MFSLKSLVALLAAATATAAITVTGPSSDKFWVFGTSNQITWTVSNGDPSPVSVTVTNPTYLSGPFSIAEFVTVTDQSFTVTNVTLHPGTGYSVNFIDSKNGTVYASSSSFEVKEAGSPPYGATVYTVVSYSVSGTVTTPVTMVETQYASTTSTTLSGTSASSVASVASTSSVAAATATLTTKKNAASSFKAGSSIAVGILGVLAGIAFTL